MSVATEFAPEVYIPPRARPARSRHLRAVPTALVAAPAVAPQAAPVPARRVVQSPAAAPLRLTRRGVAVLAMTVAALGAALVLLAWHSAPAPAATPVVPAVVSVQPGDTLWSIAQRIAPQRDPRAVVADLQRVNHLTGADLVVGQSLRTR